MRETTESERELREMLESIGKKLREFIRAEQVMIAAGIVSKDKVDMAHEIVRGFV